MVKRSGWLSVWVVGALSCAPTVRVTHLTPPEVSLGSVHALSLELKTAADQAVTAAVLHGLIDGELPLPLDAKAALQQRLEERLQRFKVTVCGAPPCGDAALQVTFKETSLAAARSDRGEPVTRVRVSVHYAIVRRDGLRLMDMNAWEYRQRPAVDADAALNDALDRVANSFSAALLPRRQTATLPLDDGGALQPGVEALLAGDLDAAEAALTQLVAAQPTLAGAQYDLGVVYEVRGDWARAAPCYRRAVELSGRARYRAALEEAERQAARAPR